MTHEADKSNQSSEQPHLSSGQEKILYGDRIVANPEILVGKPTIKGTRIPVEVVLGHLSNNLDLNDLSEAYPELTQEDIKACIGYANALLTGELKPPRRRTRRGIPYYEYDV